MQPSSIFNRLSTYTADGVTASYTYDGDNLRQSKTVNGSTVNHLLDGANVVADIRPDSTNIYVYGNGVELFKTGGQTSRYTKSYRGDVTAVTTGDTKTEYFYDAFGNKQTDTDTSTNPFEYCGEYFDDETGLIYLRNRYYDPTNGSQKVHFRFAYDFFANGKSTPNIKKVQYKSSSVYDIII